MYPTRIVRNTRYQGPGTCSESTMVICTISSHAAYTSNRMLATRCLYSSSTCSYVYALDCSRQRDFSPTQERLWNTGPSPRIWHNQLPECNSISIASSTGLQSKFHDSVDNIMEKVWEPTPEEYVFMNGLPTQTVTIPYR